ncbi:MAG: preprotein translocase subunit SecE [bacterium]|nr:preprotein translocase subunit SecE [bacterium]
MVLYSIEACGLFKNDMNYLERIKNYFKEVKIEMSKVKWPTKNQTVNYTLVVIGVSVAVAAFLGTLDYIFNLGLNFFLFR